MKQELEKIKAEFQSAVASVTDEVAIDDLRVKFLGKSGRVTAVSARMRDVPKDEKPAMGQLLNAVRTMINSALEEKRAVLVAAQDAQAFSGIDVTLPGTAQQTGALHPITQLQERAIKIFRRMGFALADGPDIESEWHCFDALNTPADHPARNEQDTFYLPDGRLLRTHTSTVQVRVMEKQAPPIRIIAPGACYRRDEVDATHLAQFNQIEGLYVDENVSLADLKSTVEFFITEVFGPKVECRFRPHFFPFTEPSFEVDIRLKAMGGKWLELAGCGMIDPNVLDSINEKRGDSAYDPTKYTGFAFGFGVDRLAMILASLPDIRLLTENDQRFLSQFPS